MRGRAGLCAAICGGSLAVAVLADCAAGSTLSETIPPQVIREALACTAVPFWLEQVTPIEVLPETSGPPAFFYPYNHTIYVRTSSYLRDGGDWDVSRIAMVLSHEFGHAFQQIAAPAGSLAWKQFERLTPGLENVPLGIPRTYAAWRKSRVEAFAEAYRLLFGGIGAKFPPLFPISVTPAVRAYFQGLNVVALDGAPNHRKGSARSGENRNGWWGLAPRGTDAKRQCSSAAVRVHTRQSESAVER